jgi:hypothetical protein
MSLNETPVVLYLDDSEESQDVRSVMDEYHIDFDVVPAQGPSVPGMKIGDLYYSDLSDIESVARALPASTTNGNGKTRSRG